MSLPRLEITDGVTPYSFPLAFFIHQDPFELRSSVREHVFAHGGRDTGDAFVRPRLLTVTGELRADTAAAFEAAFRALIQAAVRGGKLTITQDSVSRYCTVRLVSDDSEWLYWPRYKRVDLTFEMLYPFWVDAAETVVSHVFAGAGSMTVDATGSDHIVSPTIEVDADQAVPVPNILLTNTSDGGMALRYDNPSMVAGDVLVVDCAEGTVRRNGNDEVQFLTQGVFLRLQPKANTITYAGAACTVTFKFRKAYL